MNKGTAIIGFLLCFLAGMGVMWSIDHQSGGGHATTEGAKGEATAAKGGLDHSDSPVPVTGADPTWGNPDALVTIVEISDFECPYCSRAAATVDQIKKEYKPDQVRVVWKHHPLPFHKNAGPAHVAAQAVFTLGGNDAFWKFHDKLFANQKSLAGAPLADWAAEAGVDKAKFEAELKKPEHQAKIDADMQMAAKVGASGTPAFRINGVTLSGAQPFPKFKEIIDAQLKEAEQLVASGTPRARVYVELSKKQAKAGAEEKPAEPADDPTIWRVPVLEDDPVRGPKDALVTLVMWSDFQCPYCSRVEPTITKLLEEYKGKLRVVWKDNALEMHKQARPAAQLGRVAYKLKGDAGFWEAHDALFANQAKLKDEAGLKEIAEGLSLPWDQVESAIKDDRYGAKIDASMELAEEVAAQGTPHFFVNGYRVRGAQPYEKFKEVVDDQLKVAEKLVADGTPAAKVYEKIMETGKTPPAPEKKDMPAKGKDSPVKGKKTAPIVIFEYSDFECPYCSRVTGTVEEVLKKYPDDVQVVWVNMPLPFHKKAPLAAEAAYEAYVQKGDAGFWKFHDALFAGQKTGALEREGLEKIAEEIGLDLVKFKKALDDRTHQKRVEADIEAAKAAGVSGTPAFLINGYFVSGAQPFSAFKKAIELAKKDLKK